MGLFAPTNKNGFDSDPNLDLFPIAA